jgi:hypothetical protein
MVIARPWISNRNQPAGVHGDRRRAGFSAGRPFPELCTLFGSAVTASSLSAELRRWCRVGVLLCG